MDAKQTENVMIWCGRRNREPCWQILFRYILHAIDAIQGISLQQFSNDLILHQGNILETRRRTRCKPRLFCIRKEVLVEHNCYCNTQLHNNCCIAQIIDDTESAFLPTQSTQFLVLTLPVKMNCASSIHNVGRGQFLSPSYQLRNSLQSTFAVKVFFIQHLTAPAPVLKHAELNIFRTIVLSISKARAASLPDSLRLEVNFFFIEI